MKVDRNDEKRGFAMLDEVLIKAEAIFGVIRSGKREAHTKEYTAQFTGKKKPAQRRALEVSLPKRLLFLGGIIWLGAGKTNQTAQ